MGAARCRNALEEVIPARSVRTERVSHRISYANPVPINNIALSQDRVNTALW